MLEDDGCSCDWRLDVERQARSSSGLSVVSGSRLSLASAPQCFPLTKRKGGGGKKAYSEGISCRSFNLFCDTCFNHCREAPIMDLNAKGKLYASLCMCVLDGTVFGFLGGGVVFQTFYLPHSCFSLCVCVGQCLQKPLDCISSPRA